MSSANSIYLVLCFFLASTFISQSSSKPIILKLVPNNQYSSENPKDRISNIAKSTLQRAFHLKHGSEKKNELASLKNTYSTPLFSKSDGGDYSIFLSLGTPPQKIPAFFDTGSSLVWVPCTSKYSCPNCTQNNAKITTYLPQKSLTKHSVKCTNKKCRWLDQPNVMSSCQTCTRSNPKVPDSCSRPCFYIQAYGSGGTFGKAIFENLNLPGKVVFGFLLGCSLESETVPEGIVGFGRSPMSLPNQLKLSQFSYCLASHKFDDTSKSSKLILGDNGVIPGIKYTPLLKNPPMLPFNQYYYVQLDKITVGRETVKIPREIHVPDSNGNGGTIVDSGSTLTSMAPNVFDPLVEKFVTQLSPAQQERVGIAHAKIGNLLCTDVTGQQKLAFPKVVFHFKGGAKMALPVSNYLDAGGNILCLPFVNATFAVGVDGSGPGIILGNYQQQNFYIQYDIQNKRLGLKKQNCEL